MCRITSVDCEGGKAEYSGRKILVHPSDDQGLSLQIMIHLDGKMKGVQCKLGFTWKFAPENLEVQTADGVCFPSNRLGGKVLVPQRVTGFDSRKICLSVEWTKKQIKEFNGSFDFLVHSDYAQTNEDTVLINSGRGIDSEALSPEYAAQSSNVENVTYIPIEVLTRLCDLRIRKYEDGSTHIDVKKEFQLSPRELESHTFEVDFLGLPKDVFVEMEIDDKGIPSYADDKDHSKINSFFEYTQYIVENGFLPGKVPNRSLNSTLKSIGEILLNEQITKTEREKVLICISLIRIGLKIGGRPGKKFIDKGLEHGTGLFDMAKKSPYSVSGKLVFGENNSDQNFEFDFQVLSIIALIHMKKAGYRMKKADFTKLLDELIKGISIFSTQDSFFAGLQHLESGERPVELPAKEATKFVNCLDWINKVQY